MASEILSVSIDRTFSISLGNVFLCLNNKKVFSWLRWNFTCFRLFPLPFVLSLGTSKSSLAPFSSSHPIRYLYTWVRPPEPSFLHTEQPHLSQPPLHIPEHGVFLTSRKTLNFCLIELHEVLFSAVLQYIQHYSQFCSISDNKYQQLLLLFV